MNPTEEDLVRKTLECPRCGSDRVRYVEDVPAIRMIRGQEGARVLVEGLIDDFDYEEGHDGVFQCRECSHSWPVPEGVTLEFV